MKVSLIMRPRLLLYLLLMMVSSSAIGESEPLTACYADWPPYSYQVDGKPAGISIEIYNAILQRADIKVNYSKMPWARCKAEFLSGKVDLLVDGDISIPNSLHIEQGPVLWILIFWVHQDSPFGDFKGYSQFENQSIGYVRDYGYPRDFIEYQGFREKYDVLDDLQGLKMLAKGRLQAFFGDVISSTFLVNRHQLKLNALGPAMKIRFLTLSFGKQHLAQHTDFNRAFMTMLNDGSIDDIYKKHLGMSYHELLEKYGD